MATEEEVFKIIAKVEGETEVKRLAASADFLEKQLKEVIATMGATSPAAKVMAGHLADVSAELKKAEGAAGMSGQKLLQLGNTLDDLQYVGEQGLRPIINNVMQLSPVLGTAMIAAQLLYTHWDTLMTAFGMGKVKTQAEEMEELAKKTAKTADETARLAKYERERAAIKAQETTPTEAQSLQEKDVNQAIIDGPREKVDQTIKDLYGQRVRNAQDTTEIDKQKQILAGIEADEKAGYTPDRAEEKKGYARKKIGELEAAIEAKVNDWIREFRGRIATDPKALQSFIQELDRTGKDPALSSRLKEAAKTPEEREDDAQMEVERQREEAWNNRRVMANLQGEADRKALDEEVNATVDQTGEDIRQQEMRDVAARKAKDIEVDATVDETQADIRRQEQRDKTNRERAEKQKSRDDLARAKESAPGVEGLIKDRLKDMLGQGMSKLDASAALTSQLSDRFGASTASGLVAGQMGAAQEERMMDFINGPESNHRNSQVIDAASLASSIQSAVGGDTAERQLAETIRVRTAIEKIASEGTPNSGPRPIDFMGPGGQAMVT